MPAAGSSIISTLTRSSLNWGTYRRTNSRQRRRGERYLPVRIRYSRQFGIYNCNRNINREDVLGVNIFNVHSSDGIYCGILKAAGNFRRGQVHAKQLQGNGNLRALQHWLTEHQAEPGDRVRVTWVTEQDIELEFLGRQS